MENEVIQKKLIQMKNFKPRSHFTINQNYEEKVIILL